MRWLYRVCDVRALRVSCCRSLQICFLFSRFCATGQPPLCNLLDRTYQHYDKKSQLNFCSDGVLCFGWHLFFVQLGSKSCATFLLIQLANFIYKSSQPTTFSLPCATSVNLTNTLFTFFCCRDQNG